MKVSDALSPFRLIEVANITQTFPHRDRAVEDWPSPVVCMRLPVTPPIS